MADSFEFGRHTSRRHQPTGLESPCFARPPDPPTPLNCKGSGETTAAGCKRFDAASNLTFLLERLCWLASFSLFNRHWQLSLRVRRRSIVLIFVPSSSWGEKIIFRPTPACRPPLTVTDQRRAKRYGSDSTIASRRCAQFVFRKINLNLPHALRPPLTPRRDPITLSFQRHFKGLNLKRTRQHASQ